MTTCTIKSAGIISSSLTFPLGRLKRKENLHLRYISVLKTGRKYNNSSTISSFYPRVVLAIF